MATKQDLLDQLDVTKNVGVLFNFVTAPRSKFFDIPDVNLYEIDLIKVTSGVAVLRRHQFYVRFEGDVGGTEVAYWAAFDPNVASPQTFEAQLRVLIDAEVASEPNTVLAGYHFETIDPKAGTARGYTFSVTAGVATETRRVFSIVGGNLVFFAVE